MAEQYLSQTQQQRLQMVLAPQLRQSLELLQVPALELVSLVQQELQQNPTLEEKPSTEAPAAELASENAETPTNDEANFKEAFDILAKLDDEFTGKGKKPKSTSLTWPTPPAFRFNNCTTFFT